MNNQRRKELANIINEVMCVENVSDIKQLEGIKSDIEMVLMDEEWAFESMPENLQYSMRGEASQEAQDNMNEAIDAIDEFMSNYEDYEANQIHDFDEDEDEEANESEIEDNLQDLIDNVVEYLMAAAE